MDNAKLVVGLFAVSVIGYFMNHLIGPFWTVVIVLCLVGLYVYYVYSRGNRDIHEGNYLQVQMTVVSTWVSGVLLFMSGYAIASGVRLGSEGQGTLTMVVMGVIFFIYACLSSLPKTRK